MMVVGRDGEPVRVLLVEDNPGDVRLIREAMREACFQNPLQVARTGEEALGILRESSEGSTSIDLVLLDLNLPGLSGLEVLQEIKSNPALSRTPVVVLTSSQAEDDISRAYSLHANCYITKPVDLDGFLNIVQSIEQFWICVVKLPMGMEEA